MATTGPKRRPDIYAQLRPRKTRARSGCLACRARRKKCDEAKPSCQACFRLQLKCTWAEDSTLTPMQGGQRADLPAQPQVSVDAESTSSSQYTTTDLERDESNVNNVSKAAVGLELYKLTDTLSTSSIVPYNDKIALDVRDHVNQKVGPEAAIIFDHFCHKTAPWMINGHSYSNPVLRFIVPLIARDELILNTVIAISGTHLAYTLPTVEPLATTYYALALQSLRSRLSEWVRTDRTDYQPLFAAIILLCHSEFISGNTYGAGLQHLRACREFVEVAIKYLSLPDEQDFAVFLLEHYGYFALVVNLRCSLQKDNIHLGLHFADHILPLIRSHPSFGSIFAFEPESLALIPQIALLAWQRYQDASQGDDTPLYTEYTELLERIDRERYPVVVSDDASISDLRTVILIKTNTLLMLTHASFYECRGDHSTLLTLLQPLVENAVTLLKDVDETDACYGLFWSVLITGSYIQDRSQQDLLVRKLGSNQSQMSLFARGIELLQWMWHGQDRSNFGLSGLEKTAVAHGVEICIC